MSKEELSIVEVDGWRMAKFQDEEERRIRDVDLGERLGLAQPRNIRAKIKEYELELKKLGVLVMRTVSVQNAKSLGNSSAGPGRPSKEYWLNKDQALLIAMHSGAAMAGEVSVKLIQAYNQLRATVAKQEEAILDLWRQLQSKMGDGPKLLPYVRESPDSRVGMWDWDLADELARLYGLHIPERTKGYPAFMSGFIGWLHDLFPEEIIGAIRERSKEFGAKRYQLMTDLTIEELKKIQTMLRMALNSRHNTSVKDVKEDIAHAVAAETARRLGIPRSVCHAVQVRLFPYGKCEACGSLNQARALFCQQCGHRLAA